MSCSLLSAISFADDAHRGQFRDDGTPYIEHPIAVLHILWKASLDLPLEAYITAVLHDVLEDTHVQREDLLMLAGENVTAAVEALTRPVHPRESADAYVGRMLADANALPYVPLVKLADRIHNIETSAVLEHDRRMRLQRETCDLYLPSMANIVPVGGPEAEAHAYLIGRLRRDCAVLHVAEKNRATVFPLPTGGDIGEGVNTCIAEPVFTTSNRRSYPLTLTLSRRERG